MVQICTDIETEAREQISVYIFFIQGKQQREQISIIPACIFLMYTFKFQYFFVNLP